MLLLYCIVLYYVRELLSSTIAIATHRVRSSPPKKQFGVWVHFIVSAPCMVTPLSCSETSARRGIVYLAVDFLPSFRLDSLLRTDLRTEIPALRDSIADAPPPPPDQYSTPSVTWSITVVDHFRSAARLTDADLSLN